MRRQTLTQITLSTTLLVLALLASCKAAPKTQGHQPLHKPPTQPEPKEHLVRDQAPTAAQMQELLVRLQSLEVDNAHLKKKLSDQYMQAVAEKQLQLKAEQNTHPINSSVQPQPQPQPILAKIPNGTASADLGQRSRTDLLDALMTQIVDGQDPDRVKALMAAALSLASDQKHIDPRLIDVLDPKAREQVVRFHQMVAVTFDQLASDRKAKLTRRDMIKKIDEVFGNQPLHIGKLALCRRVDSYGVYEPFATTRFLAGQKNRVLVYVELENFKHHPTDDGEHEVRLEQSVELYDATGETTVWRQGPVELVDVSRNKRRDFFIVYPIDLPARLPAGGYRLKVRVADKHTGSLCEQTMHDIHIVADEALLSPNR